MTRIAGIMMLLIEPPGGKEEVMQGRTWLLGGHHWQLRNS